MKHIPILRYQDVSKNVKDTDTTSIELLEYQLRYLRKKGFESTTLEKLAENPDDYSPKTIVLTFDGGYLGHYQYVFPLLQQYRFNAVFFIPTDFIGGLSAWGPSRKTLLCFEDIFEMYQWGMEIGVNSATHTDLSTLADTELDDEILQSKKTLEKMLTAEVKYFSYPFGKYNSRVKDYVQRAGYTAAVSIYNKVDGYSSSRFALDRIELSTTKTLFSGFDLKGKINGSYK